jgi:hypothetical protein
MGNEDRYETEEFLNLARWARVLLPPQCASLLANWEAAEGGDIAGLAVAQKALTRAEADGIRAFQEAGGPAPEEEAFGREAVRRGYMSRSDLQDCFGRQQRAAQQGERPFLASVAFDMGRLTEEQVLAVLESQEEEGKGLLPGLKRRLGIRSRAFAFGGILRSVRFYVALGILVIGIALLVWRFPRGEPVLEVTRICADPKCGCVVQWQVSSERAACPKCGGERLLAAFFCETCKAYRPYQLEEDGRGGFTPAPCPVCGKKPH